MQYLAIRGNGLFTVWMAIQYNSYLNIAWMRMRCGCSGLDLKNEKIHADFTICGGGKTIFHRYVRPDPQQERHGGGVRRAQINRKLRSISSPNVQPSTFAVLFTGPQLYPVAEKSTDWATDFLHWET